MEFARRGPATGTAAVDEDAIDEGRRFVDPQPHGDAMPVIRDALLSQLQQDRLRQEIIVAEIARIERAMALRSAASHHGASSSSAANPEHRVGVDDAGDLKKEDGLLGTVCECSKTSGTDGKPAAHENARSKSPCSNDKSACQEKAASDECKQESDETVPPKKIPPSVKWSCGICQVEASSEGNLMQHFAGQKHWTNIIALIAKARAEKSRKASQYAGKPDPRWVCKFCLANCTGKSDLENHLKGKKHLAKIQALLEECKSMAAGDHASRSREADSNPPLEDIQEDEGKPDSSLVFCGVCQVKCTSPLVKESHVRGKKHQMNVQALQLEAKRLGIIPPKMVKKQKAPPGWDCTICQAKCNSESQFHDHCRSLGHQKKMDSLQREGTNNAHSIGSDSGDGASLEGETQKALYFCKLCNLQCNSKNTLAEHRQGKKHLEKVEKRMLSSFCHVCNLQCNSEKMLAHHYTGSKHKANLNGC